MRKLSMDELGRATPGSFRQMGKMPVVLVLDNVRSALNVGSAFRTADAFALEKIYLCGITATPPHREILKTALGSTETVEWEHLGDTSSAVLKLQNQGYELLAVEQTEGSVALQKFEIRPDKKYALIFGNEVSGVGDEVLAAADGSVEILQFGTKHSLNVAVCIGIVAWHFTQKIRLLFL
ncbi:MAG: RNA methyltransferase [Bacteroidetes bacterium]|nr:RNA methyltransferase [Bacteroidota bacterium]